MMAESLESRKFERKQQFDLALPVRSKARETPEGGGEAVPLAWALARPRHFFEDHAVIVRRMVQS